MVSSTLFNRRQWLSKQEEHRRAEEAEKAKRRSSGIERRGRGHCVIDLLLHFVSANRPIDEVLYESILYIDRPGTVRDLSDRTVRDLHRKEDRTVRPPVLYKTCIQASVRSYCTRPASRSLYEVLHKQASDRPYKRLYKTLYSVLQRLLHKTCIPTNLHKTLSSRNETPVRCE